MNPNYGLMVELKPNFQKELFSKLLKEYGRFELSSLLKRAPSILYHYKNCRVKSLDLELAYKSLKLAKIRKSSLKYNILRIYSAVEDRRKIFDSGIQARMNQIQIQFNSKCSLNNFIDKEGDVLYINIKKWFIKTKWIDRIKNQVGIINWISGPIFKGGKVILEYEVYKRSKNKMEKFVTELPEKLEINEEFMYFLGMRYGDGTSNARIGVVNKNLTLLSYISKYLKKIFPNNKIQGLLYLYKKDLDKELLDKIKIYLEELVDEFQIIINKKMKGDYVAAVFVINNFFDKIYINITQDFYSFFKKLNYKQKGAFLAGMFDAEGNVNKLDKNLRFSQKIKTKVDFMINLLQIEGYNVRYDLSNLIIGYKEKFRKKDFELFKNRVLPYMKHPAKKREAMELLNGNFVRDEYKELIKIVKESPGIDTYGISNVIHRKKNYGQLTALTNAEFLLRNRKRVDETFKYFVTKKGINWIKE